MAATLLIWIYTLITLFLYGALAVHVLRRLLRLPSVVPVPPILYVFSGAALLTTLVSFLSLGLRLNIEAAVICLAGAAAIAWTLRRELRGILTGWAAALKNVHPLVWTAFGLALLLTLEIATHKPANSDTGLYHAQAIRWIETYRVVPGLGNLHGRLAYNSSWFVLAALFSFPFLHLQSFHLTGSVLFVACLAYFAEGVNALFRGIFRLSALLKAAFLPLSFYILASEVSSTGTDLPVTLLTWVVVTVWLEQAEAGGKSGAEKGDTRLIAVVLTLLVVFSLVIKLSSAPLLLLPLVWLIGWVRGKETRLVVGLAGLAVLILVPWVVRNVLVSGYVAYPQAAVDLFPVDWKIPRPLVVDEAEWITSWARYPRLPKEVVLAMPVWRWAATWFSDMTRNRQLILLVVAAAPFALALAALSARLAAPKFARDLFAAWRPYLPAAGLAYLGVIFWFFTVPRFRFGYGFIMLALLLVLFAAAAFALPLLRRVSTLIPYLASGISILYLGLTLAQSVDRPTLGQRLVMPMDYVNLPTEPCAFDGFSTYCATQYEQCGYEPFPCVPAGKPDVEMRGSDFQDGFRTTH